MSETANKSKLGIVLTGIIKENPVLVLVLGTCPTLACTTSVSVAVGMGAAATVVLICSNILISMLRNIIPETVRIPSYIVVIAAFVSIVEMLVQAYFLDLYNALGVYLPLIVVNCIILGRAEMFANKNTVVDSALDGLGMGLGFCLTLVIMATIREVLGFGTWYGMEVPFFSTYHMPLLAQTAGGFFVYGLMIAAVSRMTKGRNKKNGCGGGCGGGCAGCGGCGAGKEA